jgi:hypothetical protein
MVNKKLKLSCGKLFDMTIQNPKFDIGTTFRLSVTLQRKNLTLNFLFIGPWGVAILIASYFLEKG